LFAFQFQHRDGHGGAPNTALTQKYKTTTKQTNKIEIGKYRNGGFVFLRAENETIDREAVTNTRLYTGC